MQKEIMEVNNSELDNFKIDQDRLHDLTVEYNTLSKSFTSVKEPLERQIRELKINSDHTNNKLKDEFMNSAKMLSQRDEY